MPRVLARGLVGQAPNKQKVICAGTPPTEMTYRRARWLKGVMTGTTGTQIDKDSWKCHVESFEEFDDGVQAEVLQQLRDWGSISALSLSSQQH